MANFSSMSLEWRDQKERNWNAAYEAGDFPRLIKALLQESEGALARRDHCYDRASLRAWAGDGQAAIDELEQVFVEHPYHSIYLRVDPAFASIRNDTRFRAIVGRIGLDSILSAQN